MNVKVNDNVLVIAGKDKGKQGKVLATSPKTNTVTVEGVRIQKKHEKARKANETSQIVEVPAPIDASNVMVICSACGKAVRVKHAVENGKKTRVCGKCGAVLDGAFVKKSKAAAAVETEAPKKRTRKRVQKAEAPAEETATPVSQEEAPVKKTTRKRTVKTEAPKENE